ncbi:MAG TPA: hypothetical protein VJ691_14945 [Vicinamibacterales bacterium]|nr:hypothetical protein [Vicinamibacterales bacterium]
MTSVLRSLIVVAALLSIRCGESNAVAIGTAPSATDANAETLFSDDFESGTLSAWQDGVDPSRHRIVTDASSAHSGSRYLVAAYPAGRDGGWLTRFLMPGHDALYVSYDVRFPQQWSGGTKLVALYGSRADDQWSAFGKASLCPNGTDFFAAMVVTEAGGDPGPARFYTYYPAMRREPNGVTCFGRFGDGSESYVTPLTLSRGVWHRIEFAVALNTPGRSDARQAFWIDGVERGNWSGFSFRASDILRLNAVQLTFSADAASEPREVHVDNVVVAARRR